jgi:ABC-2 type transport system ATP-binding protein
MTGSPGSSASMISIEGLNKKYGATHAVRGISFEVPKGQVVGFLGPNGAGKSTTMKILTGYVEPTGGVVKVAGISVPDDPVEARKHIGYLPENNPLYEEMMVDELLQYVATMRRLPKSSRAASIARACERCGIGGVRGKDIGELSKGYRQRVGLAQAILHDPDLLILDEPTTGLDPNQVVEIRNLIRELGREKTVILSTHVLPEVQHMCSRAVIISEGKIVADGAPDSLAAEGGRVDIVVARKSGAISFAQVRELFKPLDGVMDVTERPSSESGAIAASLMTRGKSDPRRALFDAVVREDLVLLALEHRQMSLEETFRKLTTTDATKGATVAAKEGAHA